MDIGMMHHLRSSSRLVGDVPTLFTSFGPAFTGYCSLVRDLCCLHARYLTFTGCFWVWGGLHIALS